MNKAIQPGMNTRNPLSRIAARWSGVFLFMIALIWPAIGQETSQPKPKGKSRADLYIESFGPAPAEPALRARDLEMHEIEAGTAVDPSAAARSNEGHEQVIYDYMQDRAKNALALAATGKAAFIPEISKYLSGLLTVARQDALSGREELAMAAQDRLLGFLGEISGNMRGTGRCRRNSFGSATSERVVRDRH